MDQFHISTVGQAITRHNTSGSVKTEDVPDSHKWQLKYKNKKHSIASIYDEISAQGDIWPCMKLQQFDP